MTTLLRSTVHLATDWQLTACGQHADPWSALAPVALLTSPDGTSWRVPLFWNGGQAWIARVVADAPGTWQLHSICSEDIGLHDQRAELIVSPVAEAEVNPLLKHGPIRIDGARFVHHDGTPFSWLGDTWWMLLSDRVRFPDDFTRLVDYRVAQGFTVVQLVVGFPPDITPFDGRDGNEGGTPWEPGYARINPGYFEAVDARLRTLIAHGIVPCLMGSWGYHLLFMGAERMAAHWRYMVARYAAWPVILSLAGEGAMPFYLSTDRAGDSERLRQAWPAITKQVRATDPWRRPLTLHPRSASWDDTLAPELLDFHMLQCGHMPQSPQFGVDLLATGRGRYPTLPIVQGEPPYEGHGGTNGPDTQRWCYWSTMLGGAAGYTYGAAGIFQANDRARPTGFRPDGGAFDRQTWDESLVLPGAQQVAMAHRLLIELGFAHCTPHPEWLHVDLQWGREHYHPPFQTFAAGIAGELVIGYIPLRWYHWDGALINGLTPGNRYRAWYLDPEVFTRHEDGEIVADAQGQWRGPTFPYMHDWVVIIQRV